MKNPLYYSVFLLCHALHAYVSQSMTAVDSADCPLHLDQ